jgi:hypothetical protein
LPRVEAHLGAVVPAGRLEDRVLDVVELDGTQPAALPDEEPVEDDAAVAIAVDLLGVAGRGRRCGPA